MNEQIRPFILLLVSLCGCPLLAGVINRTKAVMAGRKGPPLVQPYRDLGKLLRKTPVYSDTAGWLFRFSPIAVVAGVLAAALLTPWGVTPSVVAFRGDFLLWAGFLTFARVAMILAALDVGSSFEGMGASREQWFAVLAEPALFLALAALAVISGEFSMGGFFLSLTPETTARHFMAMIFAGIALVLVALAENARIPVDDPNTHLELTMIHEVMILDHSGPDLAFMEYASALKLWIMGALAVATVLPSTVFHPYADMLLFIAAMLCFAVVVGLVESLMARLRLVRVPQFLVAAAVLSALSLLLVANTLQ